DQKPESSSLASNLSISNQSHMHTSFLYLFLRRWPLILGRLHIKPYHSPRHMLFIPRPPKPTDYLLLVRLAGISTEPCSHLRSFT
ncbi:putative Eyes absent-like protein, partial [Naja naja]